MNFYIDIVLAHIYQLVLALKLGHFEDGLRLRIGHPWGLKENPLGALHPCSKGFPLRPQG